MPALPVAEHRAPCAWPIREQDGRARSEPSVLPATHEPSNFWSSRQAGRSSVCVAVRQHPRCEQHMCFRDVRHPAAASDCVEPKI